MSAFPRLVERAHIARRGCGGVSLVELVVFIVVAAIVTAGLVLGMSSALRTAPVPKVMHQGLQLAQGRMEVILEQRNTLGFAAFSSATFDPCVPPGGREACLTPATFAVASCFYTGAGICGFGAANTCNGVDVNYSCVRVRATGPDGSTLAELDMMFANY